MITPIHSACSTQREVYIEWALTMNSKSRSDSKVWDNHLSSSFNWMKEGNSSPKSNHTADIFSWPQFHLTRKLFNPEEEEIPLGCAVGHYYVSLLESPNRKRNRRSGSFGKSRTAAPPPLPLHYPLEDRSPRDVAKTILRKANEEMKEENMEEITREILKENGKQTDASSASSSRCIVCLDNPADTVVIRCGHFCMCYTCAEQQWVGVGQGTCPICRNTIQMLIRPT